MPSCPYCETPCYVTREMPVGYNHKDIVTMLMATCEMGAANDRRNSGGLDYRNTVAKIINFPNVTVKL